LPRTNHTRTWGSPKRSQANGHPKSKETSPVRSSHRIQTRPREGKGRGEATKERSTHEREKAAPVADGSHPHEREKAALATGGPPERSSRRIPTHPWGRKGQGGATEARNLHEREKATLVAGSPGGRSGGPGERSGESRRGGGMAGGDHRCPPCHHPRPPRHRHRPRHPRRHRRNGRAQGGGRETARREHQRRDPQGPRDGAALTTGRPGGGRRAEQGRTVSPRAF
jgi:hypothetical protein